MTDVTKLLLEEVIPKFGLPYSIQSDHGQLFTSWRPEFMGKTEKMNPTIKKDPGKICQETHLKWDQALLIVLL